MKSFFQLLLASFLGIFAAFGAIVLFFVFVGISGSMSKESYSSQSILKLELEGIIPEKTGNLDQGMNIFSENNSSLGLQRILDLLEQAAQDDKIKGILIENRMWSNGQATLLALTEGLKEFKKSGKFIYSYADFHTQSSYLLASVADSVLLNPNGSVDLVGYGATIPFFKNMLDRLGVEMKVFYAGDFKSATEPFRGTEMSEYNRIQTREFLEDMKDILVSQIAENRNLSRDSIEKVIDNMEGRTAQRAMAAGLIDAAFYKDELDTLLHQRLGLKEKKKVKFISLDKYSQLASKPKEPKTKNKVAVVVAEGEIQYGTQTPGTVSDAKYLKLLSKIRQDKDVKAVVLRVNSPGGSAFTSDIIWREIEKIKEKGIPVVASFGDYAASGGYYISAGADKIIAQPNTLTGSIGVFSIFPDVTKLVNDKMGINFDTVKTDEFAAGLTPFIPLSEREKELLQESTLDIYDLFLDRVSSGRKLSLDSTKVIARGRVWTGRKAKEIGLVDELGDLEDAITMAAEMADVDTYNQVYYPTIKEDFLTKILQEINKGNNDESTFMSLSNMEKKLWQKYQQMRSILKYNEPQTRLPFIFQAD